MRVADPRPPAPGTYDVVIAGASFAGLAAAQRLSGKRVVLVDRAPLGEGLTSACAAPVSIVRAMGAEDSIQQVHDRLVLHTPAAETVWPLGDPFCTFDYRRFCALAHERAGAEFYQASVRGRDGAVVHTTAGNVTGAVLVDATGWRAALAGSATPPVGRRWMAFGIESEVPGAFPSGLHFYFLPEVRDGYAWAFPCGGGVRFGVLSYRGRTRLSPALETFMARFGRRPDTVHGGFLASGLRSPVVDGVLVTGDASGHCLPLTGEGIRTAVLGGFRCGEIVRQVLDGGLSRAQGAAAYRAFTESSRRSFRALVWGNLLLLVLPLRATGVLARWLARPRALRWFLRSYLRIFAWDPLQPPENAPAR